MALIGRERRAASHSISKRNTTLRPQGYPTHGRAIAFWRRAVATAARPGWSQAERDHPLERNLRGLNGLCKRGQGVSSNAR